MPPYSLYLHIPFCNHRCGYCDFNTYAGLERLIPAYVQALCAEIRSIGLSAGERLKAHTVFFGGGTPSLLAANQLARIVETIAIAFDLAADVEITLEANPGTLSPGYLQDLHRIGINRLSLGVQSANPNELRLLERQHDYVDVIRAVAWARQAGFDNLSLDLIFGLPYQELESWQRTLSLTSALAPEHFSLYALTLEHGTPFGHWLDRGLIAEPDPDLAAEMYEWAMEYLDKAGFTQYEISNWGQSNAQGDKACRHNLQYWRNLPYLGLGAGAHGYASGVRTVNTLAPAPYIQRLTDAKIAEELDFPRTPATQTVNSINVQTEISETMMMGLRLVLEGVSDAAFDARFGQTLRETFGSQIERLVRLGLLEWLGDSQNILRLTRQGRLLGNQVFVEFI